MSVKVLVVIPVTNRENAKTPSPKIEGETKHFLSENRESNVFLVSKPQTSFKNAKIGQIETYRTSSRPDIASMRNPRRWKGRFLNAVTTGDAASERKAKELLFSNHHGKPI